MIEWSLLNVFISAVATGLISLILFWLVRGYWGEKWADVMGPKELLLALFGIVVVFVGIMALVSVCRNPSLIDHTEPANESRALPSSVPQLGKAVASANHDGAPVTDAHSW